MQNLTLEEVATLLSSATIHQTHDMAHAFVHSGTDDAGRSFVLMNNMLGESVVTFSG